MFQTTNQLGIVMGCDECHTLPVLGPYVAGQPSMLMIHTYPEKTWDVKPQKPEPQWSTILPNLRFDMISNVNESLTEALPRKTHGFVFYLLIGGPSGYSIWLGNGIPIYSLFFAESKVQSPNFSNRFLLDLPKIRGIAHIFFSKKVRISILAWSCLQLPTVSDWLSLSGRPVLAVDHWFNKNHNVQHFSSRAFRAGLLQMMHFHFETQYNNI